MRIVMTGATGNLGRAVLFELIQQHRHDLAGLDVTVLGRGEDSLPLQQRLTAMLHGPAFPALGLDLARRPEVDAWAATHLHAVDADLGGEGDLIGADDLRALQGRPVDYFFHIASLTDFRDSEPVVAALERVNVRGTVRTLALAEQLDLREYIYTGSAYACGMASGVIAPDFVDLSQRFRNPYERSKLLAEVEVRAWAARTGRRFRCFRPSSIAGQLLEQPLGYMPKFDVFYAWAAMLLRMKAQLLPAGADLYQPAALPLRIRYSLDSGLDIVPVDYAAKAMVAVCRQDDSGESYHLTNPHGETPHEDYIGWMLQTAGIDGVRRVEGDPAGPNELEALYYRTVGKIYTPYILMPPMRFDTGSLALAVARAGLHCPVIDAEQFGILMAYAREQHFGLRPTTRVS